MYTVMVTGGIGSGKTTLVELLCQRGALSIDLDEINRTLLADNQAMVAELAERFGDDILDADGAVITSRLAQRAFASREETRALNAISFPYITERATDCILNAHCTSGTGAKVLVIEVQLLTEVPDFAKLADEVIAVCAPSDVRLARAVERGMGAEDALARMKVQATDAERAALADTVCENAGTQEDLAAWVDAWWAMREHAFEN